jgi:hypothetical protein
MNESEILSCRSLEDHQSIILEVWEKKIEIWKDKGKIIVFSER